MKDMARLAGAVLLVATLAPLGLMAGALLFLALLDALS